MIKPSPLIPTDYAQTIAEIKQTIETTQVNALQAVSRELIKLYWSIGKTIAAKQQSTGWGAKALEKLAIDLQSAFPGLAGFSRTNLFRMQAFYAAYEIVPPSVGLLDQLPIFSISWSHNIVIIEKLKNTDERLWYAQQSLINGWSRNVLELQIKSQLYQRQGKALTNFKQTLPKPHSDLAQQAFKDPYIFDFLTLHDAVNEREIEQSLIDHIQKFLLELGHGFAFMGRQYHLEVAGEDYYLDLLFYHVKLHCFIVIELKNVDFKPEFAGKLNFYLAAVDDLVKSPTDKPTIGLLLCKGKQHLTVEYALRNLNSPIGVASYEAQLVESLPKDLKGSLPSVAEIEAELAASLKAKTE